MILTWHENTLKIYTIIIFHGLTAHFNDFSTVAFIIPTLAYPCSQGKHLQDQYSQNK